MGINRIIPTSIILEIIMITTQLSSLYVDKCDYNNATEQHTLVAIMVNFFTTTIALFLLSSIMWIYYFRIHNYEYTNKTRKMRGLQGLLLMLLGALCLGTAQSLGVGHNEENGGKCATLFEINIVSGAIAILDGALYFLRPIRKGHSIFNMSADPRPTPLCPPTNNNGIFVIQHDLPAYEAPPAYSDLTIDQQRRRSDHLQQGISNPGYTN